MDIVHILSHLRQLGISIAVEDEELVIEGRTNLLTPELIARIQANKRSLINSLRGSRNTLPIVPISGNGSRVLSFAQQRLLFLDQLDPGSAIYNMPGAVRMTGKLDLSALRQTLNEIVRRHEVLRTVFATRDETFEPVVTELLELELPLTDISALPHAEREAKAAWLLQDETQTAFDLARGPLVRAGLIRLGEQEHIFVFTTHHIVSDGWSVGILVREIAALYGACSQGLSSPLPDLQVQYADYAHWQRQWLSGEVLQGQLDYWKAQLAGAPALLNLPTDRPRPAVQTYRGATLGFEVAPEVTAALQVLSRDAQASLFMTLTAAFNVLLWRHGAQDDICIGTPMANRNRTEIESLIGFFVNTVVLRTRIDGRASFAALLDQVRETALATYAHQDVPFEQLVECINPQRHTSHSPLFQVLLVLQNMPMEKLRLPQLELAPVTMDSCVSKFDLSLNVIETSDRLQCSFEYNTDLFDATTIARMGIHFCRLLEAAIADPATPVANLPMLERAELDQLLIEFNDTVTSYPQTTTIHQLFEQQVANTPQAVAVVFEGQSLTYAELNIRANQLAHHLISRGVGPDTLAGICVERSLEMIVGLLGVLKAGGAYLPLDPAYPAERLAYMLGDAKPALVLTQSQLQSALPDGIPTFCLDSHSTSLDNMSSVNPVQAVTSTNLAYVIYTSGSTGKPKGTLLHHDGLYNLVRAQIAAFGVDAAQRVLQFASFNFDASTSEVFMALLSGATLYLAPRERLMPGPDLQATLSQLAISVVTLPPVALQTLSPSTLPALKTLIVAGEACPPSLVAQWAPGHLFFNAYGPTESTVCASVHLCDADHTGNPPIGKPIANTRIYLLDAFLNPVPVGVAGELHIAGIGLAHGYLNRPGMTAEKFMADPFATKPGSRMYRSGDLARYLPNGEIEYLGRIDEQVKIRGFRIEPGEIEAVLAACPGVREAVVLVREDQPGEKRLVAYLTALEGVVLDALQLRPILLQTLPDYMVPAHFVPLNALPLTPNGKLDRRALPAPDKASAQTAYVAPRNAIEQTLAAIWAEVLNLAQVGIHDNFFELGGHSLLAAKAIHLIKNTLSIPLSLVSLFRHPRLVDLAIHVAGQSLGGAARQSNIVWPEIQPDNENRHQPFPLNDIQQAYWMGRNKAFTLGGVAAHGYQEIRFSAIDLARYSRVLNRLIQRHDMLRAVVNPDGMQQILSHVPEYLIPVLDLRDKAPAIVEAELWKLREELSHQVIDVAKWPLFDIRATLLAGGNTHLHLSMDALIVDASSAEILSREFEALYEDEATALPPLNLSFRDYVLAEQALRESDWYLRALQYWRERLPGFASPPELPLAKNPESVTAPTFTRHKHVLPAEQWSRLKTRATDAGITPSVLLLTAFSEVLATWSKQPRLAINLTLFNRLPLHKQANDIVGDFTSLSLLEIDADPNADFLAKARALQAQLWQDIDYAAVSGIRILRELAQARGVQQFGMPVVFTSTLTSNPGDASAEAAAQERGEVVHSISQTPQVWIDHQVYEYRGTLGFNWDSIEEIFPKGMLDDMFGAYRRLLDMLAEGEMSWKQPALDLLPDAQKQVQNNANATQGPVPEELLHTPFEKQARRNPERVAVIGIDRSLTYGELQQQAQQLGARLQSLSAAPNQLIAVVMEKGWEQVLATLGILYAGAAYLPIDPGLPAERLHHILERAQVSIALTQSRIEHAIAWPDNIVRIAVDCPETWQGGAMLQQTEVGSDDLAYVIYTSGSTGLPKGVMIDHRGALNTVIDINQRFGVSEKDRILALSSLSFDLSVYDIFGALAAGAAIVIPASQASRDPGQWAELMHATGVTVWNSVPALLNMLVEYADGKTGVLPPCLRLAMLSGDWIPLSLTGRLCALLPEVEVMSLGGATEASIWSIYHPITQVMPEWSSIPYGKPLKNQTFHVLDEALNPRPHWVPGALYIGGVGLAKGYWRDAERTAASFIVHPRTGERLYKTGDLGRYLPDGNIEFLGREDFQVKIQGYRIELGEIETALEKHADVRMAVAHVTGEAHGEKRLLAYVVPHEGKTPASEALTSFLSAKLPPYMIPSAIVFLDALPLSSNGKVDKKALPAVALPAIDAEKTIELHNPVEHRILQIARDLLKIPALAPDANLLLLGATSIDIVRIGNALSNELGFRPKLNLFLANPSVACLIDLHRKEAAQSAIAETARRAGNSTKASAVIDDPQARKNFKENSPGRRILASAARELSLPHSSEKGWGKHFSSYKSVRQFSKAAIDQSHFSDFISCLSEGVLNGKPKYLYSSAGGLYPIQTYLYIKPSRVQGLAPGAYYYDTRKHSLLATSDNAVLAPDAYDYFVNRPIFEEAAFAVFFIAEMKAIEPMYGEKSMDFCHVETGAMAQLLTMSAAEHQLGLCGIGSVDLDAINSLFALEQSHRLVYSMVGGQKLAEQEPAPVRKVHDDISSHAEEHFEEGEV